MSSRGVAISLFSGAGGLDLGIERAGFRVTAAVEPNGDAADSMEKNFHDLASPVLRADILDVPTADLLRAAGLRRGERPDLLVGGPPCTPFSKSGFWLDWKRAGLDPDARVSCRRTHACSPSRAPARSCSRTCTRSRTGTGRAGRRSTASCARSTRRATTPVGRCSTPPTTASRSRARGCS